MQPSLGPQVNKSNPPVNKRCIIRKVTGLENTWYTLPLVHIFNHKDTGHIPCWNICVPFLRGEKNPLKPKLKVWAVLNCGHNTASLQCAEVAVGSHICFADPESRSYSILPGLISYASALHLKGDKTCILLLGKLYLFKFNIHLRKTAMICKKIKNTSVYYNS